MKTVVRYLCTECVQDMKDAGLIFRKLPGTEGNKDECAWCHRRRYGAEYEICYGRGGRARCT